MSSNILTMIMIIIMNIFLCNLFANRGDNSEKTKKRYPKINMIENPTIFSKTSLFLYKDEKCLL